MPAEVGETLTKVTYTEEQLAEFREIAGKPVWDTWIAENQDKFDAVWQYAEEAPK
ncbi:hypothetical protein [Aliiruegeria lutimaris]|nr:hypothetical protein [Aliiruegeria lutimaris]